MDFCLFIFPISKTISKNVTSRYSQEFLDHAKQPATDALKTTSRRAINSKHIRHGGVIVDFTNNGDSNLFNFNEKIAGRNNNNGWKMLK